MISKNEFFRYFFLEHPVPMWIFEEDSLKIIAVNNAAIQNYGYSRDEFLNMTILDIRPAEDIPLLLKHLKQPRPETEEKEIWRHKKKDGSIIYVKIWLHPIEFNKVNCILITAYDVSERKLIERKLIESQSKFNTLVERSLFGIYIIRDSKFIYVNDEFARIFGYNKEEIIGRKSLYDLLDKSSFNIKYGELFERLSNNFEVKKYKFKGVKKDGSLIDIEVSSSITEYEGKNSLIGTVIDVTEINHTTETLYYHLELEKLLSRISTRFVELTFEDIDECINLALKEIGQFMDVDRSYVFQFSEDLKLMHNTHEWCAKNISSQIENLQNLPTEEYSWTMQMLHGYDVLKIPDVEELPTEAINEKEILLAQDIKSLIIVPMYYTGKLIGFIGFDSVLRKRDWNDNSASALKILGEIFSNAIARRKAESELSKLYSAIWQIHESVMITNVDGVIEYVNPAFEKLTGYKKSEVIGKTPRILKSGKHNEKFYRQLWNTITSGKTFEAEFLNKRKNGEIFNQESNITPMIDKNGKITHFICIGRDVTDKKKNEEIRLRLAAILEATSDFVSTADCNYNVMYINKNGKRMVGIDENFDYSKMKISDFHPDWATKKIFGEGFPKAIKDGFWVGETAIQTLDGKIIPTSQVIISHKNSNGEIEYYSTIMRDITDLKEAQKELRTREELYRLLLENQTDYIVKYDLEGRLLYASNTFCGLFDKERSQIVGEIFMPSVHEEDNELMNNELKKLFYPPHTAKFEIRVKTKYGWRWLGWSFKAELNEKNEIVAVVGTGRDVTERKLYESEVIEINKMLNQKIKDLELSQKEISKLLNEVTEKKNALEKLSKDLIFTEERERKRFSRELHDSLGQVLSNLKLNLDLANFSLQSKSNGVERYLKVSQDLVSEAIKEVKQLSYDLRPSVLDDFGLNAALRLLANQFQKRTGIFIGLNLESENQRYEPIIETALYRITQECLANIAKHSKATNASIQFIKRDNVLALTISDDGIGFDIDKVSRTLGDELHFGLKNIRERVEFLGGKLYIDSRIDYGTEISIEIELKT